jgi:acetyl/propionyl-CoA carboxylase alpha subunit
MIAKVIAHAPTRAAACDLLAKGLEQTTVHGCKTNLPFLINVALHGDYIEGDVSTAWIARNVDSLVASLLPEDLADFFSREDVRRALAAALLLRHSKLNHFAPVPTYGNSIGDRFASLLGVSNSTVNGGLNVGSNSEYGEVKVCPGVGEHEFRISGKGLIEILRRLDADTLQDKTPSLRLAVHRANALHLSNQEISCQLSRPRGECLQLTVFGETLTLPWPDDTRAGLDHAGSSSSADSFLKAPMAGKVLEVRVADGDKVHEGDLLFVLESMKMQLEIRAPRAGVVVDIRVVAGMTLAGPEVLAEIKDL